MSKPINKTNYKPLGESLTPFESEVASRDIKPTEKVQAVLDAGSAVALASHYKALQDTKEDIERAYEADNVKAFLEQTATEESKTRNFDVADRFTLKKLISENRKPGVTFSVKRNPNPKYRYQLTLSESKKEPTALETTMKVLKKVTDTFPSEPVMKSDGSYSLWFEKLSELRKCGMSFDTIESLIDTACKTKNLNSFITAADELLKTSSEQGQLLLDCNCSESNESKDPLTTEPVVSTDLHSEVIERETISYLSRTTLDLINYITEQLTEEALSNETKVVLDSIRSDFSLAWGKIQTCVTETAPEEIQADIIQGTEEAQNTFSEGADLSTDIESK